MIPTNPMITYKSKTGERYRVTGIQMIHTKRKWIDRTLKYHWIVTVYFMDLDRRFNWYFDYFDNFYKYVEI